MMLDLDTTKVLDYVRRLYHKKMVNVYEAKDKTGMTKARLYLIETRETQVPKSSIP